MTQGAHIKWLGRIAIAGVIAGVIALPQTALAEAHQAHSGDLSQQLAQLATGDQLVIENVTGEVQFGGHTIALDAFSGIAGYGSEVAYLITVDGEAELSGAELGEGAQEIEAGRGRMLMIPPFGAQAGVQRYDARRLHEALSAQQQVSATFTVASLGDLAKGQDRAIFLGRLGRTSFNVATMGSASQETGRRERVGGTHVRDVRFTSEAGADTLEQRIVSQFLAALAAGESAAVAQMLDPLPYGMGAMAHGGDQARIAMASNLIAQRDWSAAAATPPQQVGETLWRAGDALINLRRTTEFAYVESIEVGS